MLTAAYAQLTLVKRGDQPMQRHNPVVYINLETVGGMDALLSEKAPHASFEIHGSSFYGAFH